MNIHVWYLYHSGFAVETENTFLVFDYWRDTPSGGLSAGVIDSKEIAAKHKKVVVFSSHNHADHYNPVILRWKREIPGVEFVLSRDIPAQEGALMAGVNSSYCHAGLSVRTFASNDEGVAFLVEVDGAVIYHAGDLNWWHWEGEPDDYNEDMARRYKAQVDKLRGVSIDLAFVPVDPRLGAQYAWGADYLMRTADVKHMAPMHFGEDVQVVARLLGDPVSAPYRDRVLSLVERGQSAALSLS